MPLYETLGLITEKPAVIIDFGKAYTKFGFAGEFEPRAIIPSQVNYPENKKIQNIFNYSTSKEYYDLLVDFIHNIYFRHLLVVPKDRRVVIVESLLCPTEIRETLAKVLFRHFEVSAILFVPSHLVVLYTLGINTGLILDCGYSESTLIPVYEGVPVLHAWQSQPLAGEAIESCVRSMLCPGDEIESGLELNLSNSTIEDIKVRTCFVTTIERSQKIENNQQINHPPDVDYYYLGSKLLKISGKIRETACEVLFEQDNDQLSVSTMILDAIVKCPMDMRKSLAENIVLFGGTSMITGFKSRLFSEIKALAETEKYTSKMSIKVFKLHTQPCKENYMAWLGGAIIGATDSVLTKCITKETYLKTNSIPDWSNLSYNKITSNIINTC